MCASLESFGFAGAGCGANLSSAVIYSDCDGPDILFHGRLDMAFEEVEVASGAI